MLKIGEPNTVWAWCCPVTGLVLSEAWGHTPEYATQKSIDAFGKRRAAAGEVRAVRVTVEPLTDAEQAQEMAAYEEWKKAKEARKASQ